MLRLLLSFAEKHDLLRPGDRLGVAVSGGADSVALLRALLELRAELGLVLSIVHFNHKLRGEESDGDESFVRELAAAHGLDIHVTESNSQRFAREKELSLEAAARELRYAYFGNLIKNRTLNKVATAHTLDDQGETVLLRMVRGTGTSGLAGTLPKLRVGDGAVIRPVLSIRHCDLVRFLEERKQPWREDSTNSELVFTRNRIRHDLIPFLKKSFNPEIVESLANLAEIARGEDEFWSSQTAQAFIHVYSNQQLHIPDLLKLPLALQRRVLRLAAIEAGATLDFRHSECILEQLRKPQGQVELPNGFLAEIRSDSFRFIANQPQAKPCGYSYRLAIPGEVRLAELGILVRAVVTESGDAASYNGQPGLGLDQIPPELMVRNWRPGDRFRPAHTRSLKKVKELLQDQHLPSGERALWPVAVDGDEIVWLRGFPVSHARAVRQGKVVLIETEPLSPERK